jgi:hypothetical protein
MADITRNESGVVDPSSSQIDPRKEYNQLRPRSLRSSGSELDPCCEGGMSSNFSSGAGEALDRMIQKVDGRKK